MTVPTIVIPSAGRAHRFLKTVLFIPPTGEFDVSVVVPPEQIKDYEANLRNPKFYIRKIQTPGRSPIVVDRTDFPLPSEYIRVVAEDDTCEGVNEPGKRRDGSPRTIADTRQWCDEQFGKQIQLDDDMTFNRIDHLYRHPPHPYPWFIETVNILWEALDHVGFVGIAPRIMSQVHPHGGWEWNQRCMNVHGVNPSLLGMDFGPCPTFKELYNAQRGRDAQGKAIFPIRHDVLPVMEDFYLTLSMARAGLPWARFRSTLWHQNTSNDVGGCQTYRDNEMQGNAAKRLLGLFGGDIIRVVWKETDTGDGWHRPDVNISWKKATANIPSSAYPDLTDEFWTATGPFNNRYVGDKS